MCGSALAAPSPRSSRSPRAMFRPPSRASRAAHRPARIWVGPSSHRTSFIASATLWRPPASESANWSSVSISRVELPIQSAVVRWPAAVMAIRSRAYSSSVNGSGWASIREVTSSPGSSRLAATRRCMCSPKRWCAFCAPGPPSARSLSTRAMSAPSSSGKPTRRASTRTGSGSAYSATRSAVPRVHTASMSRSANCSQCWRISKGSTASSAGTTMSTWRRCSAPAVK